MHAAPAVLLILLERMMDEQEFKTHADDTLTRLHRVLATASDDYDFESDLNNGALTVEFENPPAKFVVSPNAPVRQIWVSALAKSYKLDWDPVESSFVLSSSGQTLKELLAEQISKHLGEDIAL
jgi:iron-sulfur cluster assembly protein CyaY